MRYLLDTNACIRILNNSSRHLVERLRRHEPWEIGISSIVKAELIYGACKSSRVSENLGLLARFFEPFGNLPFDDASAEHYGPIRAELERAGTPIGPNDLLLREPRYGGEISARSSRSTNRMASRSSS